MGTMGARPIVNHVPNLIGGVGKDDLSDFYRHHFIFSNPDVGLHPVSRTIGDSQLVDELVVTMVHDRYVDWLVPRVPPTGLTLHFPLVAIVYFEEEKGRWSIVREHIYWDQATVLVQLGVLDASGLDVSGAEQARKILDVDAEPSNQILERALARRRGEELNAAGGSVASPTQPSVKLGSSCSQNSSALSKANQDRGIKCPQPIL
eukprot:CAMPEP_0113818502 /NCGR_PEP_ID=MMETSP0328-20130328/272_1 /TAXON_ID=39455 /ORGANISM="Alexandrium minutum" /LENGTH=204 /DNA_ID=CAMNT_0000786437 /DNA_START=247 /DNA_END=862 /DNA_ORIENTATION=+ /assembly_acc=CAM_ASM_000350